MLNLCILIENFHIETITIKKRPGKKISGLEIM
jgi:hypothetical protein